MKGTDTLEMKAPEALADNRLQLPRRHPGFLNNSKNTCCWRIPPEAPFAWLRVTENVSLAFVVDKSPFLVMPDYAPDIPDGDVEFLGLKEANDALLFNIVTVWGPNNATVEDLRRPDCH